ncbi:MAG: T9SS type A sorting domain-containing protein [Calditrichaeota bacterium]|nr:T9SS type A sorting domain-containing protein [Calditrichota bacterium]
MRFRVTTLILVLTLMVSLSAVNVMAKKAAVEKPRPMPIDLFEKAFTSPAQHSTHQSVPTEGTVVGHSNFAYATAYFGRSIAVGPDGTVHIVWCKTGTPSNVTMYVRSTDQGKTFSTPIEIQDGYYGYKPSIAVHPTDPNIVVIAYVGYQNEGEIRSIRMSTSSDGGLTWNASVPVFGSAANCNNPDPAIDKAGNIYVAFDSYADNFIRFNMSTDGGITYLTEPELVNLGQDAGTFSAAISIDKKDNVHVLYGGGGGEGSWGDKSVFWNWRDKTTGLWMEVPPVQVSNSTVGSPYPAMVFDSNNVGHAVYDGEGSDRVVQYRTLQDGSWSDPVPFPSVQDGGNTRMPNISIDQYDNLYLIYTDAYGSGALEDDGVDIFTGTNISGEWQVINFTGTGTAVLYNHPNAAAVVVDSLLHLVYTSGQIGDYTIEHAVGYPWPPEPTIGTSGLSDTYNTTGPFTVTANTGDIDGFVAGAKLFVLKNGEQVSEIEMTQLEKDSYTVTFSVEGAVGDTITYYGRATDNDGNIKDSLPVNFAILTPMQPKADILLIQQDAQDDTFYTHILDKLGYVYELWDYNAHGGIDESVTNFGWSTILGFGWQFDAVPTRGYEGNPFASFLQLGTDETPKRLLVGSQDYFYANGEPGGAIEFQAGDFAYDFFQIGGGVSDPDSGSTNGEYFKDSLLVGITDDPISGNWDENLIFLNATLSGIAQWIDYTEATGEGLDIFFAANQGYGSGVSYDAGTYKSVLLPWQVTDIVDSVATSDTTWSYKVGADAYILMQNVLTWFGTDKGEPSGVGHSGGVLRDFSLAQNYPNPFNPETSIRFNLAINSKVDLYIYNAVGQRIRTLISTRLSAGSHAAIWDGSNDLGHKVASGVYFYSIKAGDFSKTMKMVMIK